LWNRVEAKETRKNSQFAREINLALPHELTEEQNKALLRDWVQSELVDRGMVADVAVHDPVGPDRHPNMHAHVTTTTRKFDAEQSDGWSKNKPRDWTDKATLQALRESWAMAQNEALEAAGFSERVDHRSLEVQKADAEARGDDLAVALLDRAPEPRLGLVVTGIERRAARAGASEPVTERGKELAAARTARTSLERAVQAVRNAVREVSARASDSVLSVMQAAIRKHSPEEAREEPDGPDDGLPGLG
jgi:ATP-dependent exoDNAse (exonuclease V) alpha subunit